MEGYDVVTIDDDKVGTVAGESGDLPDRRARPLRKSKRALPRQFAHVDDGEQQVRITVGKEVFLDSPELDGDLDEQAVREYYGLAPSQGPGTEGYGVTEPGDPARSSEEQAQRDGLEPTEVERARIRGRKSPRSRNPRRCSATVWPASRNEAERNARSLNRLGGTESAPGHRGEEVVSRRLLVVPGERDLAHQVRVGLLEPGLVPQRRGEPADAALAANAGHLNGLGLDGHAL